MGVDKPNYTQMPNLLLDDLLMQMGEAELKVTIALSRLTFGYHRDRVEISLSHLQEITHLSRQGVINGINAGLERGTIERTDGKRGGFIYSIAVNGDQESTSQRNGLVNEVDPVPTSQPNRPQLVNEVDQSSQRGRPVLVNEVDQNTPTLKKVLKKSKRKKKESIAEPAASAEPSEWQSFLMGLCNCCFKHTDIAALSAKDKGILLSEGKKIYDRGYTIEDVRKWFATEWVKDWRYGEKKTRPTPSQVCSGLPALRAMPDEVYELAPVTNGTYKNGDLSEAEKSKILTRAKSARSSIRTAELVGGEINPTWSRDIETAREYGLI